MPDFSYKFRQKGIVSDHVTPIDNLVTPLYFYDGHTIPIEQFAPLIVSLVLETLSPYPKKIALKSHVNDIQTIHNEELDAHFIQTELSQSCSSSRLRSTHFRFSATMSEALLMISSSSESSGGYLAANSANCQNI